MRKEDVMPNAHDAERLAAEVANEPQWVVFDEVGEEEEWAALELEEITLAAAWWAGTHA